MVGRVLTHYEVLDKIGQGGMGIVFKARDTELGRLVAIKVLSGDAVENPERRWRFLQEARAASALNHPHIITIHEIGHAEGLDFIVMEYVEGQSLRASIPPQGMPVKEAARISLQIAEALGAAHAAGIVHRDVKPANILISSAGSVKVLDFGLAKVTARASTDESAPTETVHADVQETKEGVILGTMAYMSPEQAEGKTLDARSDVFSLGVVLYEMLRGQRPFQRESDLSTLIAIVRDPPPPLPADLPSELAAIIHRAVQKNREQRFASGAEMARALGAFHQSLSSHSAPALKLAAPTKRRMLVPALALVVVLAAAAGWFLYRQSRVRWVRDTAIPEIGRLFPQDKLFEAFDLASEARKLAPADPELAKLWPEVSAVPNVVTNPPGADISIRQYNRPDQRWRSIGKSPLTTTAVPRGFMLMKASLPGYEVSLAGVLSFSQQIRINLHSEGTTPPGMVFVPGTAGLGFNVINLPLLPPQEPFYIDRFEVTNTEFKRFVDSGGYQKKELWKHPFQRDGRTLSFEEAMKLFVDSTGRPGPSTWEAGTYPQGKEDYPVGGVSWHEAAAFAEFSGKSLPTVSHWYRTASLTAAQYVIPASNFSGSGPAPVGQYKGASPFGTYDMAGNVKEWCWNEGRDGVRFIPGGAWASPVYQFTQPDALPPFDRTATNGFRCVRYSAPLPEALTQPLLTQVRDFSDVKPVSDEVFQTIRRGYAFDRGDLKPAIDLSSDDSPYWRREKIVVNAAYGGERLPLFLFHPKNASPPYKTVVFYTGAGAVGRTSEGVLDGMANIDFIIRSGRAVLYPVFKGFYERSAMAPTELAQRQLMVWRVQDLNRSLDYAETRPDLDLASLAYAGVSAGSEVAPVLIALEDRVKAAVLFEGGMSMRRSSPEIDRVNFAPRVKVPVLMLNGRFDYTFPLELSQKPLFRLLGTPDKDKKHVVYNTAHNVTLERTAVMREVLDFLDKYCGPVKR